MNKTTEAFTSQGEVKMSNNNMREIGNVFVNHSGEFQFVPAAAVNMPSNSIKVYCTEEDFQKACDSAKRIFNGIKGELQMLTGGKWGEAHCLNCGFSLGARITCPHCGYINSVEKTAESIHDCGGAQHHRYADHIADAGKVIAEPVKQEPVPYVDSTPHLHVGDSSFEDWYQEHPKACGGDKQLARDAYAAGMGDPLVAPVERQWVDLTDDELKAALEVHQVGLSVRIGRIAIAAFKENNK